MVPRLRSQDDLREELSLQRVVIDLYSHKDLAVVLLGEDHGESSPVRPSPRHLAVAELFFEESVSADVVRELVMRTGEQLAPSPARQLLDAHDDDVERAYDDWLQSEMKRITRTSDKPLESKGKALTPILREPTHDIRADAGASDSIIPSPSASAAELNQKTNPANSNLQDGNKMEHSLEALLLGGSRWNASRVSSPRYDATMEKGLESNTNHRAVLRNVRDRACNEPEIVDSISRSRMEFAGIVDGFGRDLRRMIPNGDDERKERVERSGSRTWNKNAAPADAGSARREPSPSHRAFAVEALKHTKQQVDPQTSLPAVEIKKSHVYAHLSIRPGFRECPGLCVPLIRHLLNAYPRSRSFEIHLAAEVPAMHSI
mmetsp:Transcript_31165/g.76020  ORF Transcript_31165/g.76020 Transcript_31165/m.76020 type:complete len:374 (+) Transcript_31165:1056-2177(+)